MFLANRWRIALQFPWSRKIWRHWSTQPSQKWDVRGWRLRRLFYFELSWAHECLHLTQTPQFCVCVRARADRMFPDFLPMNPASNGPLNLNWNLCMHAALLGAMVISKRQKIVCMDCVWSLVPFKATLLELVWGERSYKHACCASVWFLHTVHVYVCVVCWGGRHSLYVYV